jgi:hypothetical protein
MKPCRVCQQPKTYHTWYLTATNHKFEMDNLLWVEGQLKKREREDKHRKLNFCLLCKQDRKSPFGICRECSERLIGEKV